MRRSDSGTSLAGRRGANGAEETASVRAFPAGGWSPVRLHATRDTTVPATAGERDATCPPGRTRGALDLCTRFDPAKKRHHLQRGAGHDDLFEGPTWAAEILP